MQKNKYKTLYPKNNRTELNLTGFVGVVWIKDKNTKEYIRGAHPINFGQIAASEWSKRIKHFFICGNVLLLTNSPKRILIKYISNV